MSRLIIISNRLPFTLRQKGSSLEFAPSSGGLVTALAAHLERRRRDDPAFESIWVGWPGSEISRELEPRARALLAERHAHPVFLSAQEADEFYYGFCNRTLWPLFHYFPSYVDYEPRYWESYVRVNREFCDTVAGLLAPGDTIWIHDYHLLLLPELLRSVHPEASIGFFLHTPFPSYELFRLLPTAWKEQLLGGLLGADLVGFHVHEYTQHFLHCALRILGREHHLGNLVVGDQVRRVDTFPLGVDFEKFTKAAQSPAVTARRAELERELGARKIVLSVDRLDYSKGLANRLHGYERFLAHHRDWHGKVSFVMLVVPSRIEVPQYQQMRHELDEIVGHINGRFGSLDWTPIVYQVHSVPFEELVALYSLADVALITPLRDGMNLVAKEFLASKADDTGVLILSEMAGAAREMSEALLINPNHRGEIENALTVALAMPRSEQIRRNQPIRERLARYDAENWAKQFLSSLTRVKQQQGRLASKQLGGELGERVVQRHRAAQRALLLLDYDGTLVPIAARPELAVPDADLIGLLSRLAAQEKNRLFVISGRDRGSLAHWFGDLPLGLVAEHGAWLREPFGEWRLTRPLSSDWKERVTAILRLFVAQVAGSHVEEKEYSLAWHYRSAEPGLGAQRAKELIDELTQFTANLDLQIVEGKKVVEVRSAGVNKGLVGLELLKNQEPDFVLALGDDYTDEDLFRRLPSSAVTVHVGSPFSSARYHLGRPAEVRALLARLLP